MKEFPINKQELEVMKAMQTIAKYRASYLDRGFENLAILLQALLDTTSKTYKCKNCGTEHQLYVIVG